MPIRLQVCAICGRSHADVYNVRVQSVMMYYITTSRAYATADSVRNQENAQNSPDPFPSQRVGSGDETTSSSSAAMLSFVYDNHVIQERRSLQSCDLGWPVPRTKRELRLRGMAHRSAQVRLGIQLICQDRFSQ